MQQLTATDASFLTMESATTFGHIAGVSIFEPAATYDAVCRRIEERLHLLPPYRRQLVEVPMELDRPYWIESPNFDLDYHVRHIAVPPPGDRAQLAELVARLSARPLDRTRPLWEYYVIEGLESGDIAHYSKTHHATIDGASGVEMMSVLLDDRPDAPAPAPPTTPWQPERMPSGVELVARAVARSATNPGRFARAQLRLARQMFELSRQDGARRSRWTGRNESDQPPALSNIPAPRTAFNGSITAHRRWAYTSLPLDEVKRVKGHFGVTVNDVVLALCASVLRRWMSEERALPTEPLRAMCPVSIRTGKETDAYSNRVSGMVVNLATNVDDPVERLEAIRASTAAAKEGFKAVPADALQDFSQFAPYALSSMASRMLARSGIADQMNPAVNLAISNVPGPRQPLYFGSARLKHTYPVSIISDGMGLNITCASYVDSLDFGLTTCREMIPDLWGLTDGFHDALDELSAASK